jgi:hypothetical protein
MNKSFIEGNNNREIAPLSPFAPLRLSREITPLTPLRLSFCPCPAGETSWPNFSGDDKVAERMLAENALLERCLRGSFLKHGVWGECPPDTAR